MISRLHRQLTWTCAFLILTMAQAARGQYNTNWGSTPGVSVAVNTGLSTLPSRSVLTQPVSPLVTVPPPTNQPTTEDFYPWDDAGCCATHSGPLVQYNSCQRAVGAYCGPPTPRQYRAYNPWYASAAGLYLGRSESRRVWTTYENNNNANQLMSTHDIDPDWEPGADLRLGRFFGCNGWAVELGYWSVNNFSASASQTHVNQVSSPLQFNDLQFALGVPVVDYFDSAAEHRISRDNELHNVEINLIQGCTSAASCCPWSHRMLVGIRYFKFDEDLTFASLDAGGVWGGNGGLDEAQLTDSIKNDLIGVQVGCLLQRQLGCRTMFVLVPKFGVYNNHIENHFDLRRGDGTAAMPTAFSGVSGSYPVESNTDQVAFLSEANIGLQHQIGCRCALVGGYRVVTLNNIGLADSQIPQYIVDIPEIAAIDTEGSLVLHGAYLGATCTF